MLKKILDQFKNEAEFISLRLVETQIVYVSVRNEILEKMNRYFDKGLMIEVMIDGHIAYAATNNLDLLEIKKCIQKAKQSALAMKAHGLFPFKKSIRPTIKGEYRNPKLAGIARFNAKEISDLLMEITREMNIDEKIKSRNANYFISESTTHYLSNQGSDLIQTFIRSNCDLSVTASNQSNSQKRTYGGNTSGQINFGHAEYKKLISTASQMANEALVLLDAPDCPTDKRDLLLAPDQMSLQIHESIGHPLELDRILGDERNYAGKSFITPLDFGSLQYGSKLMNVTFDPTVEGQNASCFSDDIGCQSTKEYLIQNGILKRGIGSLESQERLGLQGVASQRATSWNRPPIDRMGNINLEFGTSSFLDMIKNVEKGIYMQTTRSWSIDDYRNKFQFGCEFAQLIEEGELTQIVKNPNYRGITAPFWNQLKMVGNETTFEIGGVLNCGKGEPNQVIQVGHASPACLFSNIEIFGGGK